MSRPSSSVPNQCAELGGCSREGKSILLGFCGAIHGANSANTINTATNTMPADASMLRRPSVAAVVHVVERAMVNPSYLKHRWPLTLDQGRIFVRSNFPRYIG